jgi:hypothetical protein
MGGWVPSIGWYVRVATAEGRSSPIVYDDEVIGSGLQVRWNRRQIFNRTRPVRVGFRCPGAESRRAAYGETKPFRFAPMPVT